MIMIMFKKRGHCVFLISNKIISDKWYIFENFTLSSMFVFKEAFLGFDKYRNFQSDNFHYYSEYSNFSFN